MASLEEEFRLLVACLAAVPDPRHARGRVHPLLGILSLAVLALMAGARSLSDISRWGKLHPEVVEALALRRSPSVATLSRLLRLVSVAEVRASLRAFARQLATKRRGEEALRVVAADGKTLRGVWEKGKQLHVLHLFAQEATVALDQVAVESVRGEVEATKSWIEEVSGAVPGLAVLTGDALFADQSLCAAIVAGQRDYVVRLKKTR